MVGVGVKTDDGGVEEETPAIFASLQFFVGMLMPMTTARISLNRCR